MIAVAHPSHPLSVSPSDTGINDFQLRSWRQVVIRDSGQRRVQDAGWLGSEQRWTVSHFSTSLKVLKTGLAFAFMPYDWVKAEIDAGNLKQLPLSLGAERRLPMHLMMTAAGDCAGPATTALFQNTRLTTTIHHAVKQRPIVRQQVLFGTDLSAKQQVIALSVAVGLPFRLTRR
jgi:DNA-binding transcriptional LysR family regulator